MTRSTPMITLDADGWRGLYFTPSAGAHELAVLREALEKPVPPRAIAPTDTPEWSVTPDPTEKP